MAILIVDDSEVALTVFESILQGAGHSDIRCARSALEAYRLLGIDGADGAGGEIDLILMDILMPEIDGIAACRQVKSHEGLRDIPIIIVTGMEEHEHLEAAFAAGATDYLTKPANKRELLARVRSAMLLKQEMDRRKAREKELLELT